MKKHNYRKIKVRRRKVANLAAYSRQFTVRNNTIKMVKNAPKVNSETSNGSWEHKTNTQPKNLTKKEIKAIFTAKKKRTFSGIAERMEAYAQLCIKQWEKKHPKPCHDDDLFKIEYQTKWDCDRNKALERYRDLAVSIYDKLPLIGRFKMSEKNAVYQEKKIADLKDVDGDGHKVNELTEKSKLLKKAQKVTNKVHAKHANLISTNLKDHKRHKGRIILPNAA